MLLVSLSAELAVHTGINNAAFAHALRMAADKPGVVLDVGANGGRESMAAVKAGRKVFAVECLSTAYAVLLETFRNHTTEVSVLHICGGSAAQLAPLHLASDSSSLIASNVGTGREAAKHDIARKQTGRSVETAVVLPLDLFFQNTSVALVKVDTQVPVAAATRPSHNVHVRQTCLTGTSPARHVPQGSEFPVLAGLANVLSQQRPIVMYEEVHRFVRMAGRGFQDPQTLLRPLGYHCTSFCDAWCKINIKKSQKDVVCASSLS